MSNLNMKMKSSLVLVMVVFVCSVISSNDPRRGGKPSATQGPDLFVAGKYLQFAVNPSGGLGSRAPLSGRSYGGTAVPSGMKKSSTQTRLGVVVDYDHNGWAVGSPPQSGDAFLEGYDDVGYHVSWEGASGLEEFDQSPMLTDDDDGDDAFSPYRGCHPCQNGQRVDNCDATTQDCSCNLYTTASTFIDCPFKRWDMDTVSISRTQDSSNKTTITYVGIANARVFYNSTSGALVETGEKVKVTKVIIHNYVDSLIVEHATLENIGTVSLSNVAFISHIVPTLESFPVSGYFPKNPETDFSYYISIPYQNTAGKSLIQARGQNFNMTTALGSNDQDAKAWYGTAASWRQIGGNSNLANKMFNADVKSVEDEHFREDVIALGFNIATLPVGGRSTKSFFWAFTKAAIDQGFLALQNAFSTGVTSGPLSTGVTTGSTTLPAGPLTTGVTSQTPLTTGVTSAAPLSTGVTSAAPVSTGVTSHAPLSTGVTSGAPLTTGVTSGAPVTTGVTTGVPVTTGVTTGAPFTTGTDGGDGGDGGDDTPITTGEEYMTTGEEEISTGVDLSTGVTSGITSGITSGAPVSTGVTSVAEVTTGVTTGVFSEPDITSGPTVPATTGVPPVVTSSQVTSGLTTLADGSLILSTTNGDDDKATKDRNVKIIASVFGVAGFILLVLCVGGVILAVRRMQRDPVV